MKRPWLLPILVLLFVGSTEVQATRIIRICQSGSSNTISFDSSQDPCAQFVQYNIWVRNGEFSPFLLLDSIKNKSAVQYNHSPVAGNNWYYFIETVDLCPPVFSSFTDTVKVDISPPSFTFIDSASINPETNIPIIGWFSNSSEDFDYYTLYADSNNVNAVVATKLKDTFLIDNRLSINPKNKPIRYDLSAVDSCGNAHVFTLNPHTTINLKFEIDTCTYKVKLNWTPYIGWTKLTQHYIFHKGLSGVFELIDSVDPGITNYTTNIVSGENESFFIRAKKDTSILVTASSNSISYTTRNRAEPLNSYLYQVDVIQPSQSSLNISIFNPGEEVFGYQILGSKNEEGPFEVIKSISANPAVSNYITSIPFNNRFFKIESKNACGASFSGYPVSKHMIANVSGNGSENRITWDPYSTWNVGVKIYKIYRGTSNNGGTILFDQIDSIGGLDTVYIDKNPPSDQGDAGVCYYVQAIQNAGDVNGNTTSARSTRSCVVGDLVAFIPNAFNPQGANRQFKPDGMFINYSLSEMEIYNRWGGMVWGQKGITTGWEGRDANDQLCQPGVYGYKIKMISTSGNEKTYTGTVTLLN